MTEILARAAVQSPRAPGLLAGRPGTRCVRCPRTGLVLSLHDLDAPGPWRAGWRALGERALVPNLFYEEPFASAAASAFGAGVRVLVAADRDPARADARVLGVWPVRVDRRRWGGLPILVGWSHPFSALGVPLLDPDRPEDALIALLSPGLVGLPRRILLPLAPDDGPFGRLLGEVQGRLGLRESRFHGHDRALLAPAEAEGYVERGLSSRTRGKLRQELRRIERDGPVTFEDVRGAGVLDALEDYIRLEGAGWKGRAGTALGDRPAEAAFFRDACRAYAAEGRLAVQRLRQGERTLAASVTMLTGTRAWYLKISFDETQSKNSPGSQLVLQATEAFLADPGIVDADSCAPPGHPLMRRFWSERLSLSNRLVEPVGGDPLHGLAVALERGRGRLSIIVRELKAKRAGMRSPAQAAEAAATD